MMLETYFDLSTELTVAGGQRCPNWKLTRPARVRSCDLVRNHFSSPLRERMCPRASAKRLTKLGPCAANTVVPGCASLRSNTAFAVSSAGCALLAML
jgi:hypothetical protein